MIFFGGLALVVFGAGGYLFVSKAGTPVVSPKASEESATPTIIPKTLTWDDPAGFTISYPEGLILNKHDEDTANYAHVEFTAPGKPGGIVVWVKDIPTGVTDTGSWIKKDASLSAGSALDTVIGGQPGQKILLATVPKKEIIGSVYDDALFYVEITLDAGNYWQGVADSMLQSFTFKPINTQANPPNNTGNSDTSSGVDEEEVLQ